MTRSWRPGRDRLAERLPAAPGRPCPAGRSKVAVIGGGIAGLAAATALTERGVQVVLLERQPQLGGRVRAWPVRHGDHQLTMSRGFHAFFRQYYNLRALLRRTDPGLRLLRPVTDYPITAKGGPTESFARIPRTPPLSIAGFVAQSPSFTVADLTRVDLDQALGLLDVDFPRTFRDLDGISAAEALDRLGFPSQARHLALEVFARSFFADPDDFGAGELIAMFHSYFLGSAEGLLFDVPVEDYDTALWAPLGRRLVTGGAEVLINTEVTGVDLSGDPVVVRHRPAGKADSGEQTLACDAAVIALDPGSLAALVGKATVGADPDWQQQVAAVRTAPPFAVWRMWLDRPAAADRPVFLGTSGYGPLDNVTLVDRFEAGAERWAAHSHGSVIELHAYALAGAWRAPDLDDLSRHRLTRQLKDRLRAELAAVYPETRAAGMVADEWRVDADAVLVAPHGWADRPMVGNPDPRVVLAGDAVRCDLPVALMERAATTGFQAANQLLAGWGVRGHDLWTVPRRSRHRWPGRFRRLIGAVQPGNSPRRRNW